MITCKQMCDRTKGHQKGIYLSISIAADINMNEVIIWLGRRIDVVGSVFLKGRTGSVTGCRLCGKQWIDETEMVQDAVPVLSYGNNNIHK